MLKNKNIVNTMVIIVMTFAIVAIDTDNLTAKKSILGFFALAMALIAWIISLRK